MLQIDPSTRVKLSWLLGALGLLVFFLIGIDQSLLFDVDEGAFSEATREMFVSRDWWHTTLNGEDRFDKPIGVYWLQAISVSLFGITEFGFRFPSAMSAWLASLALAKFSQHLWGYRAAVLTALISATSLGPWAMSQTASADALLSLFFVLTFLDLWRALTARQVGPGRRVALWMALGLLVKGPIALVLPFGSLFIFGLLDKQSRTRIFQLLKDPWSWFILIAVALPWYVYAYFRHGQNFIDGFILKHNIERFTGSMESHTGHWAYFLVALPLLWLPWSPLLLRALFLLRSQWHQAFLKYCWVWCVFVLLFFSMASTKLPHYLLYAGPAVCLLITYSALSANRRFWLVTWTCALIGFSVLLFLPEYLIQHSNVIKDPTYRLLIEDASSIEAKSWLFVIPLIFYIKLTVQKIIELFFKSEIRLTQGTGFIAFAIFQIVIVGFIVLPWWSRTLQSPVYELSMRMKNDPRRVVQWGVHLPSFSTYRQQSTPRRTPSVEELALVKNQSDHWTSDWEAIETKGPYSIVRSRAVSAPALN